MPSRQKRIKRHKRHFQLLEMMVAAFILLVCIAPTMQIFTSMYQSQQGIIRENQRDHLAHLVHAKFVEQLYKREIPLPLEEDKHGKNIELKDSELSELLKKYAYRFSGTFTILKKRVPKGQEKPIEYLGKIEIKMKDLLYKHKASEQEENRKIQNGDPAETFYDYYIYISSKDPNKKEEEVKDEKMKAPEGQTLRVSDQKPSSPPLNPSPVSSSVDEEEEDDDDDDDDDFEVSTSDEEEDDE
jgi:hypothetical protein